MARPKLVAPREPGEELTRAPPYGSGVRRAFAVLLVVVLGVLFFRVVGPFLEPLFLGAIFSGMLYPVYERLRPYVPTDGIASLLTTLAALLLIALPVTFLVGVMTREALRVTEVVGPWVEEQTAGEGLFLTFPGWLPYAEQLEPYRAEILERLGDIVNQAGNFVFESLSRATQSTVIFVLHLFVMLYAIFFFLLKGPSLLRSFLDHTPLSDHDKRSIPEKGLAVTRATLKSLLVIGALQGILGGIAFAVAGIESAMFWGLVMAIASAIPPFGAALIWAPAAVWLLIDGEPIAALGLAAWSAIVVSSIDNVLRPHLVGTDTRMPDLLILVSTLGGLALYGPTGIVIGPVLAGVFLTSLHIFAATFEREIEDASESPRLIEPAGAPPKTPPNR